MDPAARQGVEVHGERRDEGLALTGLHLGDPTEVQRHAAHQLHVEVPLAEHPPCRLPDDGIGLDQQVIEGLAVGQPGSELHGLGLERLVGEGLHGRLELVDGRDELRQTSDLLALTGAQDF